MSLNQPFLAQPQTKIRPQSTEGGEMITHIDLLASRKNKGGLTRPISRDLITKSKDL